MPTIPTALEPVEAKPEEKKIEVNYKAFGKAVKTEDLDKKWAEVKDQPNLTEEEAATVRMLDDRLSEAKEAKQRKHDIWNFSYLQYRSVNHYSMLYGGFPTYWNQWGMGVFVPRTFEAVESIKVQLNGKKPDFTVSRVRPSVSDYSQNIHNLTKSEWARSQSQAEVAETIHDMLVYGTGIARTDLINDRRCENVMSWKKVVKEKEDGTQEELWTIEYEYKEVQKYYGVGCKRVDPYDFYPNPSPEAYKMKKLGWCFERSVVDAWDLREEYRILKENGAFGVTNNWEYIKPGGDVNDYKYLRSEIDKLYSFGSASAVGSPGNINDLIGRSMPGRTSTNNRGKIELWSYWENDRYIVMTGTGLILRDSPNPYPHKELPYDSYNLVEMNQFFSMGIPEYIRWLQICENVLYDQGLNNIIMAVHKMFAVNSRYLEDEGELVARPFGVIHLKQIPNVRIQDAIMPIEYSHQMGNYFEFMKLNTENIQTVTGVSPYQTGGVPDNARTDTATASNRLAFAGTARIQEISRHIEDSLVTGVVEKMVAIIQFYYQNTDHFEDGQLPIEVEEADKNYFMQYLARDSGEITEEDINNAKLAGYTGVIAQNEIQGRCKVVCTGSSTIPKDPDTQSKLMMEFGAFAKEAVVPGPIDPLTGQPGAPIPVFDITKVSEEIAKNMLDVDDVSEFLYKPAEQAMTPATPAVPALPGEIVPQEAGLAEIESAEIAEVLNGGGSTEIGNLENPEIADVINNGSAQPENI